MYTFYDITQLSTNGEQTTTSINPLNSKRAIVAKTTDGRRQQLYCMRSASFKSFNRNSRTSADSEETTSSSCHSLNALSTKFPRQLKPTHQSVAMATSGLQQRQYHQQQQHQPPYMSTNDGGGVGGGGCGTEKRKLNSSPSLRITESALRRSNIEKTLESKKRVVKMLFVLVLEFFICWTPLYVINTLAMFIGPATYEYVDYTTISFLQLLAYSSSCCNPITYCFMNASFRRAFVDTFRGIHLNGGTFWHKNSKTASAAATNLSMAGNSIAMGNSCTVVTANTVLDSPRL
ncbi:vasopressin V1a receptor-like [Musca vetustissima]|uniref:vasopressin V1a receptor-like n=1 Tax=Musca vetustissima TaxID=27455 RepID=UPI002AB5F885|nr:vasopressin V1a receptor-like [Musca vetustissima]